MTTKYSSCCYDSGTAMATINSSQCSSLKTNSGNRLLQLPYTFYIVLVINHSVCAQV